MSWPTPQAVRQALQHHRLLDLPALPGRTNHLPAGVLVPLSWEPDPVAVLTLRASALRRHANEVSFPGGRPDPEDADLQATALREAREEVGIEDAEILGRLSPMPLYTSDYRLVPFVAAVRGDQLQPQPAEVAELLRLSIAELLDQPHLQAIPYTFEGQTRLSPVFFPGGYALYGATAHTLFELLEVVAPLFDRPVPPLLDTGLTWQDVFRA